MFDNLYTSSLEVNNLEENPLEVNNLATSDELEAKANYADGETEYSVFKRDPENIIKVATISLATILGGLSVFDIISPKGSVSNVSISTSLNRLDYSFRLDKKGLEDIFFVVSSKSSPVYELKINETKTYEGSIDLASSGYEIEIISSSSLFGSKQLYKENINL